MNKTSTGKTVCPYFCSDGKNYIRCEFGRQKITLRCGKAEKDKKQAEHCYTFAYSACPVARINEKYWKEKNA